MCILVGDVVTINNENSIKLYNFKGKKRVECEFDAVVGSESSQEEVYNIVKNCTCSVISGTNSTIFAYGQTGSGKVTALSMNFCHGFYYAS